MMIRRQKPNLKSLITAVFRAVFIEFWVNIVNGIPVETVWYEVITFITAITCAAIYLRPKLSANLNDDITVSLNEVFEIQI